MRVMSSVLVLLAAASVAVAQDPAPGWMSYATGYKQGGGGKLTHLEGKWRVLSNPVESDGAFYSPWIGIESSDNLNLFQPVNPWTGGGWEVYGEYFQWSPVFNKNSDAIGASPGDELYATVDYVDGSPPSYKMVHRNLGTGQTVNFQINVQEDGSGGYKTFDHIFVVFEKSQWPCAAYPPDNEILFYDLKAEFDNQPAAVNWTTSYVDDHCQFRASVVNDTAIRMTWQS